MKSINKEHKQEDHHKGKGRGKQIIPCLQKAQPKLLEDIQVRKVGEPTDKRRAFPGDSLADKIPKALSAK